MTGIGKEIWDISERVLNGAGDSERFFAVMYAADPSDDAFDERIWAKANPGYPKLIEPEALRPSRSKLV